MAIDSKALAITVAAAVVLGGLAFWIEDTWMRTLVRITITVAAIVGIYYPMARARQRREEAKHRP